MIFLKKASTNIKNNQKGKASCLGTSKLLLVVRDLHAVVGTSGVLLLLGANVYLQQSGIENKDRKARGGVSI